MSTLYEKLGGEKTVKLVVEKFYERVLIVMMYSTKNLPE